MLILTTSMPCENERSAPNDTRADLFGSTQIVGVAIAQEFQPKTPRIIEAALFGRVRNECLFRREYHACHTARILVPFVRSKYPCR
jgi:hypothetical protein